MTARTPADEAARRRRLAALGDVSARAADDSDEGWSGSEGGGDDPGDDPGADPRDAGLRREVPPHHG